MKLPMRRNDDALQGDDRMRELLTPLNLHYAGVAVLGLVCLYLLVQVGVAWHGAGTQNSEAMAQQEVALKTAQIQARPLQGLDAKLVAANTEADAFYRRRLPVSYSDVLAQLGVLSKENAIRLNGVQYSQALVMGDEEGALTQVKMDASLTGEYRGLVEFINGLERDRQFFLITGVTLTGAQSGAVNLRMRLTTYLRAPLPGEEPRKLVLEPEADMAANPAGGAR